MIIDEVTVECTDNNKWDVVINGDRITVFAPNEITAKRRALRLYYT
jgi:hypothetical protein